MSNCHMEGFHIDSRVKFQMLKKFCVNITCDRNFTYELSNFRYQIYNNSYVKFICEIQSHMNFYIRI